MARGRGRASGGCAGKSLGRGNISTHGHMPTVPSPTFSPQQRGASSFGGADHINQVQTSGPSSAPPIQTSDMPRGRGRASRGRAGQSLGRGTFSTCGHMPTVPSPIFGPQQGGASSSDGANHINQVQTSGPSSALPIQTSGPSSAPPIQISGPSSAPPIQTSGPSSGPPIQTSGHNSVPPIQTSGHGSTPSIHLEPSLITPNQSNTIGEGTSSQSNIIGEVEYSSTRQSSTLLTIFPTGLEPSRLCSERICNSFKHELDPNGINWKSVSDGIKKLYFGEFKKHFHWDSSIDTVVEDQWRHKAALRYSDFISKIKKKRVQLKFIPDNVWQSWISLWEDPKCIENSEINARNRCGGESGVAPGTHTGGSINVGEHRKRLAVENGRDPTPSEMHLHLHIYDHDGTSFVGEKSRIVHEKYQEILQQQTQTQSDIDQCQAYYQAAGGEKKRRVYGLGSQAKCYYGQNLRDSFGCDATSSTAPQNAQSIPTGNLDEFVMRLIPVLTEHIVPVIIERVHGLASSPSHQPNTDLTSHPSIVTPTVPTAPTAANVDEVHSLGSDD